MANPFIRSVIVENQAPSADGVYQHDLVVNPLSHLLLVLRPLNETSTATNYDALFALLAAATDITVAYQGVKIFSMSAKDLLGLLCLRYGIQVWQINQTVTDNERRCITLPIPMGARFYDESECFPKSRKGELSISLTLDIANTGYDTLNYTIEAVELPGAAPDRFQRVTTLTRTSPATGINLLDLPIGNRLRSLLLWGTTTFTGATPAPSFGRLSLLLNNKQTYYSSADLEVLFADPAIQRIANPSPYGHFHNLGGTGAAGDPTVDTFDVFSVIENYALLDLDPTRDDRYTLDTQGLSSLQLSYDCETADAVRVCPIEQMQVADLPNR